jgi:hypothetical protein
LLLVAGMAGGCSNGAPPAASLPTARASVNLSPRDTWLTAGAARDEYSAAQKALELPVGRTWPVLALAAAMPNGEHVKYELGYGRQNAEFHWYCACSALREVLKVRRTNYFRDGLDARNRAFLSGILTQAQEGNLHDLRRDVQLNCA